MLWLSSSAHKLKRGVEKSVLNKKKQKKRERERERKRKSAGKRMTNGDVLANCGAQTFTAREDKRSGMFLEQATQFRPEMFLSGLLLMTHQL